MTGSQCFGCKFFHNYEQFFRCDAFPEGIPSAILKNAYSHRYPYPGDHGIRYEMSDDERQARIKYGVPIPD
jgi:hypothetical protein